MSQPETPTPGSIKLFGITIEPLNYLLLAMPVAIVLHFMHASPVAIFVFSCIAIIPLAGLMGRATENLSETMGAGIGGLLNATFGNAAELIIAIMVLAHVDPSKSKEENDQLFALVKASLTGSILGNILLVLGLSVLAGGMKFKKQTFNRTAAGMGATLLALAAVGLLLPTLYYELAPITAKGRPHEVKILSEEIALILIFVYGLSLVFTLRTHRDLFTGEEEQPTPKKPAKAAHAPEWSRKTSLIVLAVATAGVALVSEFLVDSVGEAAHSMGMTNVFVGVIVVAVIGNAAEHSTAVLVALKNKMDLSVNIAVGSSIQIALFVAPVLVFVSLIMGHPEPLDLHFTWMEVIAVVIAVGVLALVAQDGETHWMEGVLLLAVYGMLAFVFFHMPESPH